VSSGDTDLRVILLMMKSQKNWILVKEIIKLEGGGKEWKEGNRRKK
jgi:hypothetical protein